jgi:cellulose synthase/poly-beta-1,6-N-acetylglucosamine synthase-like glycosyltransferase
VFQEEGEELNLSLTAIAENLEAMRAGGVPWYEVSPGMVKRRRRETTSVGHGVTFGHVACVQFCIFIVIDGRAKMTQTVVDFCTNVLKIWNNDMLRLQHRNNEVTCHIFQRTVRLPVPGKPQEFFDPLQLCLVVKEKNGGKLNSHLWYFRAFCENILPSMTFVRSGCWFV